MSTRGYHYRRAHAQHAHIFLHNTHTHIQTLYFSRSHTHAHTDTKQSGFVYVFPVPLGAVLARGGRPPPVTLAVVGAFAARPARARAMAAARGALPPRACGVGHRRPGNKVNGELQQARSRARVAADMKCGAPQCEGVRFQISEFSVKNSYTHVSVIISRH